MNITTSNPDHQKIIERVYQAGQEHVFRFWDALDDEGKKRLLQQLQNIDFDLLQTFKKKIIESKQHAVHENLQPADFIPLPQTSEERTHHQQAKEIGEKALRAGRVAAFLVAGGQGTRLGFDGPKGKFPISPVRNKPLFQLHAEKLLALSRRYDVIIPWYIMTSETNHSETVNFFEQKAFFGLQPENVTFFRQEMVPALDQEGRLILDQPDHIFRNPNGHGGSLSALKKSGALDDMKRRGVDLIFYFQVDNVLLNMCDPVFLGFHLQDRAEMSAKIVTKTDPEEKVGVVGHIDGRTGVIEYSDLPDEKKHERNPDGTLRFRGGSIAIHIFDRDFVERENEGGLRLPWHVAHKKIPYLDSEGNRVEPEEPNGYKFETFVFDALGDARDTVFMEVQREREFSPVKNAEGVDSPQTARRDLIAFWANWLEKAGVTVPRDPEGKIKYPIEISALFALEERELSSKIDPDFKIEGPVYLD